MKYNELKEENTKIKTKSMILEVIYIVTMYEKRERLKYEKTI
jgi:hypothetical protein